MPRTGRWKKGAIQLFLVCALVVMSTQEPSALTGNRGMTVKRDWMDIVLSLWFSSRAEYMGTEDRRSLDERRAAVQRGEPRSFVMMKADKSRRRSDYVRVTCADFVKVPTTEIDPKTPGVDPNSPEYEFLRRGVLMDPVSVIFKPALGGVTRFLGFRGFVARERYWVAAYLPENSVPLFNENGIGINSEVLSRPLLANYKKWTVPSVTGWAAKLKLRKIQHCDGFDIYEVEYRP